jgi:hypothetical protein
MHLARMSFSSSDSDHRKSVHGRRAVSGRALKPQEPASSRMMVWSLVDQDRAEIIYIRQSRPRDDEIAER